MKVVQFYAKDHATGDEVNSIFTPAAEIVVLHEDGSLQAKVLYAEGTTTLLLTFEIDPKMLLPKPQMGGGEPELFDAWRSSSGPPAGDGMTKTPGGR